MKLFRTTLALGVALTAISAGVSAAQAPDVSNPESVNAWLDENGIASETALGRWITIGAAPGGVFMQTVTAPKNAEGVAGIALRVENFVADEASENALSQRMTFDVNCSDAAKPLRPTGFYAYAAHNLTNEVINEPQQSDWLAQDNFPFAAEFIDNVCAIEAPTTGPGTQYANDFQAGERWVQSNGVNLTTGGATYSLVGFDANSAVFYRNSFDAIDRVSRTVPRVVLRFERIEPKSGPGGSTSETRDFDLNCASREFRPVRVTQYPDRNLAGQGSRQDAMGDWRPVTEHPILRSATNDICDSIRVDADNITRGF